MFEYERMADRYGASVTTTRALQIVSIPANLGARIDVGIDKGEPNIFGWKFGLFRRHLLVSGVYVYGDCAKDFSNLLASNEHLCSLIKFILLNYAYRLELSESELCARINTYEGIPHNDGTGGERFISTLSAVAHGLCGIDQWQLRNAANQRSGFGPVRFRKILLTSLWVFGFWVPLIATKIMVHFAESARNH